MRIKIRYANSSGFTKLENFAEIKEVMINEDFMHPDNEAIALGFKNKDSSGIIEFTVKEFDKIVNTVGMKKHLIKSMTAFGKDGAIKLK